MCGCLTMRTEACRPSSGTWCVLEHGSRIAAAFGVVGQPAIVCGAGGPERPKHGRMQLASRRRSERLLDRQPGQFVAKPQVAGIVHKDAAPYALVDGLGWLPGHGGKQPHVRALPEYGRARQHLPRRRRQPRRPRKHRVAHGRRQLAVTGGKQLGDVERIAPPCCCGRARGQAPSPPGRSTAAHPRPSGGAGLAASPRAKWPDPRGSW